MTDSAGSPAGGYEIGGIPLGTEVTVLLERVAEAELALEALAALGVDAVITPRSSSLLLLQEAQEAVRRANVELGQRVQERTAELETANRQLLAEANLRRQIEKEREALLVENERQRVFLQAVIESIADSVRVYDPEGGIILTNPAAQRLNRNTAEQLRQPFGERIGSRRFLREDGRQCPLEQLPLARALRGETVHSVLVGVESPDGELRWLSYSAAPVTWADQPLMGAVVTSTDVTELRAAQRQLQDANDELTDRAAVMARLSDELTSERARLQALIEHVPVGILMADRKARLQLSNPAADRLLGQPVLDAGGNLVHAGLELLRPDGTPCPPEELPLVRSALFREAVQGMELRILRGDGTCRDLSVTSVPILGPAGEELGAAAAFQDMTIIKEAQRERDRLEAMKAEFMANVSHELRSPLASVLGYSELLLTDEELSDIQLEFVTSIFDSGQRLDRLVNELLDLSRLESAEFRLDLAPVDIRGVIQSIVSQVEPAAKEAGLTLVHELQEDLPSPEADAIRLEQVMGNLLSNAVKFTPAGGKVTIRAAAQAEALVLEVSDTGIGIPSDEVPSIFGRFSRARNARGVKGTGLGLYIVKTIVTAHGGSVEVESEPGSGSTFRVCLPLSRVS